MGGWYDGWWDGGMDAWMVVWMHARQRLLMDGCMGGMMDGGMVVWMHGGHGWVGVEGSEGEPHVRTHHSFLDKHPP